MDMNKQDWTTARMLVKQLAESAKRRSDPDSLIDKVDALRDVILCYMDADEKEDNDESERAE